MLEKQFAELRLTGNMPSPTGVGLALLQATQREDVSLDEVVKILASDPTLTGRLIKLANSGTHGGVQRASTAHEAAVRLGLRTVRNVSLGFSLLAGQRSGRCRSFDYEGYWSESLAIAVAAQAVAAFERSLPPTEAFTCGLLSGIGRLALASVHPEAYEKVLETSRGESAARLADLETEALGAHHRELAAAMLLDWKLPDYFAEAVALVGSGVAPKDLRRESARRMASALLNARDLARAMTLPEEAPAAEWAQCAAELESLRERLELTGDGLDQLWSTLVADWTAWGELMQVRAETNQSPRRIRERAQGADRRAPLVTVEDRTRAENPAPEPELTGLRVLLVGMSEAAAANLRAGLEKQQHSVRTSHDSTSGLAEALAFAPHVVVCEWDLAGNNGLDLVRTLRRSDVGARMHCVMLAEPEKSPHLLEVFEAGADEYLFKPFDPRILLARVSAAQRVVHLNERVELLLREREDQVSKLAILTRKLQVAAVTDALTGLYNRRYAMERLAREVEVAVSADRALSVIMVDIDHFKSINDGFGHDVGDTVLRETARTLRSNVRRIDSACRIGGEEFLVICPGADLKAGVMIAERLRAAVEDQVIKIDGVDKGVTISLGVAELDRRAPDVDQLVKCADRRVYLAKDAGRNRLACDDSLQRRSA